METSKTISLVFTKKRKTAIKVEFIFDSSQSLKEILQLAEKQILTELNTKKS